MAVPGPTTQRYTDRLAGNQLRLARAQRGWSQRQLVESANVPVSTVARIESGARQPSLVTVSRLLALADLELQARIEPCDAHDDVLDEVVPGRVSRPANGSPRPSYPRGY